MPSQIRDLTEIAIKSCPVKNVSQKFLDQLRDFLGKIIEGIASTRMKIGLKDGLESPLTEKEIAAEQKDIAGS